MSLHHFFLDDQIISREESPEFALHLAPDDAKHARVLRLAPGEHIAVVDASKDYFECEVVSASSGIVVRVAQKIVPPDSCVPQVVLVQGIAKGDKMDDIVRHATELGITEFLPLASSRCIVKLDAKKMASRTQRWRSIARSACMQCGRLDMPEVHSPASVKEAVGLLADATAVLVCWEECPSTSTIAQALQQAFDESSIAAKNARIAVVVGPEGGLAADEVRAFTEGCKRAWPVTLGPTILRTETAGVVAPALVLYECGGMGASRKAEK